jgi:hypothetical protein
MKSLLPILAMAAAAIPAQAAVPTALPGVADEETTVPSGGIMQFHRGNGDNLFVLDRAGRWYRLGLNEGCLSNTPRIQSVAFDYSAGLQRIDGFTRVIISDNAATPAATCQVKSIRRSEAPPQVDSESRGTLD